MKESWRDRAAPIVAAVVREVGLKDPVALRKALREAYPFAEFGQRSGASTAYQAWLKEIVEQVGGMRPRKPDPGQMELF